MNDTAAVQLVCFDLGRVLIHLCDGWADAMASVGAVWTDQVVNSESTERMFTLLERLERGEIDTAAFAAELGAAVDIPAADIQAALGAYLRKPMDGIDPLIDALTALPGVTTACLSNTNALHWQQMHETGGPHYLGLHRLDYRFASHLLGHCKPAPAIYAHVEQATAIPPQRIMFFDDREENVAAAVKRGWQAHQILPQPAPVPQIVRHLHAAGINLDLPPDETAT